MLLPGSPEGVVKDDSGWLMKGDEEKEEQEERAFSDSATVFRLTSEGLPVLPSETRGIHTPLNFNKMII